MTSGRTEWRWTPETEARLTVLWKDGLSARQIAEKLGAELFGPITRSGVLGKVNRMGLPRRRDPQAVRMKYHLTRPKQTRPRKPKRPKLYLHSLAPDPAPEPIVFTAGVWSPLPGSEPVTMEHLSGCKWPVSDPFAPRGSIDLFCNCEPVAGEPYCSEHVARSVGRGTSFERSAVKNAATIARMEKRTGDQARERAWARAA